jgi:SOUL heme-binding protein
MAKKRRMIMWAFLGVAIAAIAAAAAGPIMSRVEQPKYTVTRSDGAIQIRDYGSMIAAEVEVSDERRAAINEGFRLIAGYIFGANKPNAKIAMTAPVEQQAKQTIVMTAPVTQQSRDRSWTVRFIMPKSWTMETLPKPTDDRVQLVPLPSKQMVAIRFSGVANDALIAAKTSELRQYAADNNLSVTGEPVLAFYNPPWTLPFFRRNEIMLELTSSPADEGTSG